MLMARSCYTLGWDTTHNRGMPTTAPDIDAVLGQLRAVRVVPVVTINDAASAVPMTRALVEGGLTAVEITLRTAAGMDALRAAAAGVPDALVGAGTVTTAEACEAAIDAGAQFVVSPGLVDEVVAVCARRGVLSLPGIATPTELYRAIALGCRTVKLFPASVIGGPAMVKALAALGTGVVLRADGRDRPRHRARLPRDPGRRRRRRQLDGPRGPALGRGLGGRPRPRGRVFRAPGGPLMAAAVLTLRPAAECRFDAVALGRGHAPARPRRSLNRARLGQRLSRG